MRINIENLYPSQSIRDTSMKKVKEIYEDMKEHGYDEGEPIIVTRIKDGNNINKEFYSILDGHHRVIAAIMNKYKQIPVIEKEKGYIIKDKSLFYDWEDLNEFKYGKYPE